MVAVIWCRWRPHLLLRSASIDRFYKIQCTFELLFFYRFAEKYVQWIFESYPLKLKKGLFNLCVSCFFNIYFLLYFLRNVDVFSLRLTLLCDFYFF